MKRFQSKLFYVYGLLLSGSLSILHCTDDKRPKDPLTVISDRYQKYCSSCHGGDGSLSINGAVKLKYSLLSLEERFLVISNGRNAMTGFTGILDSLERVELAAYTMKFNDADGN
ncbi:MAG: cytochrome c [Saprospiraceae bacterium]|nr:cytochrome c [Saprospiraceae bacterium]